MRINLSPSHSLLWINNKDPYLSYYLVLLFTPIPQSVPGRPFYENYYHNQPLVLENSFDPPKLTFYSLFKVTRTSTETPHTR